MDASKGYLRLLPISLLIVRSDASILLFGICRKAEKMKVSGRGGLVSMQELFTIAPVGIQHFRQL